jgi:hypothetical protein
MRQDLSKAIGTKRIVGLLIVAILGLSIIPFAISPVRAAPACISGYSCATFASGFANQGPNGVGPVGLAFDGLGNLFVGDYVNGIVYKYNHAGMVKQLNAVSDGTSIAGLAFSIEGHHLYLARQGNRDVIEIDPSTAAIIKTIASGINCATGLATDPLSGDLFVSQPSCSATIERISNPEGIAPTVGTYASVYADGLVFGPDGTLYTTGGNPSGSVLYAIDGTNSRTPGRVNQIASIPTGDGIAISLGLNPPFLYSNDNDGTITEIYLAPPCTGCAIPPPTKVFTGGSRGDFDIVGADHCLYATQTDSIIKLTNANGGCGPAPLGQLFENHPSVTTGLFTSSNVAIRVGGDVPVGTSVYDTAQVINNGTTTPTGSVVYTFYTNGECSGSGTTQIVTLSSGLVPNSNTQSSLSSGDYAFQVNYLGDNNYFPSTSPCEWFTVGSDFDLKSSGSISTPVGFMGSNSIIATLTSGTSSSVSLMCTSGLPAGASCSFNPTSGIASFTSTLTITASSTTPTGWSTITVTGTGGGLTRITRFLLTVTPIGVVGGVLNPVDKLGLLAPFITLGSLIVAATTATAIYAKRVRRGKENE